MKPPISNWAGPGKGAAVFLFSFHHVCGFFSFYHRTRFFVQHFDVLFMVKFNLILNGKSS